VWRTTTPGAAIAARQRGCSNALRRILAEHIDSAAFARATDLLLRPRPISADHASDLGLAHEVVPASELEARAMAVAAELAAGPTVAFGAVKQALAYSAAHNLVDSLEMEAALQTVTGTTDDHAADRRSARGFGHVPEDERILGA